MSKSKCCFVLMHNAFLKGFLGGVLQKFQGLGALFHTTELEEEFSRLLEQNEYISVHLLYLAQVGHERLPRVSGTGTTCSVEPDM
jgi:hypothetical protein